MDYPLNEYRLPVFFEPKSSDKKRVYDIICDNKYYIP
jgi:hypothetical protein